MHLMELLFCSKITIGLGTPLRMVQVDSTFLTLMVSGKVTLYARKQESMSVSILTEIGYSHLRDNNYFMTDEFLTLLL